ncbi:MAG: RiPP maturation radical SAM protein 1 [Desulfarculus sp.]|nr:RiPP maturation radical SAM protein 1 [Desulfarculus sp.]
MSGAPGNGGGLALDGRQADVVLVCMPYSSIECPSAGLGVLQGALLRGGVTSQVVHADLLFAERIGINAYRILNIGHRYDMIGEWTFAGAAFPEFQPDNSHHLEHLAHYFRRHYGRSSPPDTETSLMELFAEIRQQAGQFVDQLARAILAKAPKVVGCSSTFEQHLASLALLRRIRELDGGVVTLLGGANCEGVMGLATAREFDWVDVAFSGEADEVMVELCGQLMRLGRGARAEDLPTGAITRQLARELSALPPQARPIPRALTHDMDRMPDPDYTDYFNTLEQVSFREQIIPGVLMETSRGCWWGRCTFCGLNGCGSSYRAKSPRRVLDELARLSQKYGRDNFGLTDTVVGKGFWRGVLPELAQGPPPYRLFFETRSNLDRGQVALLARAGVRWVQPGIEGLHGGMLRLMKKGVSVFDNIQMLKYCREKGIYVVWHLLAGFPGEDDAWHLETAAWLPLVYHLQPVGGVKRIRFDRFCGYQERPQEHGLTIEPFAVYRNLYPLPQEALTDLAYYFRDARPGQAHHAEGQVPPGIGALRQCQEQWAAAFFGRGQASLYLVPEGQGALVHDSRPCAPAPQGRLDGLELAVLQACDPAVDLPGLLERLGARGARAASPEVMDALERLRQMKLLLEIEGRMLGLALEEPPPALETRERFPPGCAPIPRLDIL